MENGHESKQEPQPMPGTPTVSWVSELLQRVPSHMLLAALFIYTYFTVNPQRDAFFWQQFEKQRTLFIEVTQAAQARHDAQIKEIEAHCLTAFQAAEKTGQENQQLLQQLLTLLNRSAMTRNNESAHESKEM
jgi:uridine phosphorylase